MVVIRHWNLPGIRSLERGPVEFTHVVTEVMVVTTGQITIENFFMLSMYLVQVFLHLRLSLTKLYKTDCLSLGELVHSLVDVESVVQLGVIIDLLNGGGGNFQLSRRFSVLDTGNRLSRVVCNDQRLVLD